MSRIVLPSLILLIALVLRNVGLKTFPIRFDEQITRAVANDIWKGDLRNNWKYADVPAQYRVDCYNFSSYMYADALAVGPHNKRPLDRERLFSALTGSLAIFLFYLVALRLCGFKVAVISLAIMAVMPLLVQDSHYARPESFVLLLCAAVYFLSLRSLTSPSKMGYLAAGSFCCGLLIACKISLVPVALIPLVCLASERQINPRSAAVWAGFVLTGTFAGVPDAFFHPGAFWNGVEMLRVQYRGQHAPHALLHGSNSIPLVASYFWQTAGPAFCFLCPAGIIVLAKQRKYFQFAIIALPVLFYLVVFSLQPTFFERNFSHIVPLMAILSSLGLVHIADVFPRRARIAMLATVFALTLLPPALLSTKLVFVAMRTTSEERAKGYTEALVRKEQVPLGPFSDLLSGHQVDQVVDLAASSDSGLLVPIYDYHDEYTPFRLSELKRRIKVREVGYFPSLFPQFSPNTIITYHSPSVRYVRVSPPAEYEKGGFSFVPWRRVAEPIPPGAIRRDSWVENGVYPLTVLPKVKDQFFGSYTREGDANRGTIFMGPFDVSGATEIGVPIVTGPVRDGLSVLVLNHATGLPITQMTPPPVFPNWRVWRIAITANKLPQIDILAKDEGAGWGQWLAIGLPVRLRKETGN